jgi:hypothetical protein
MISKKLLSEVLNTKVLNADCYKIEYVNYNTIQYFDKDIFPDERKQINIHELANKCKEWAYERDYLIYSIFSYAGEGSCYITKDDDIKKRLKTFSGDSEPESIFKACEWILSQKEVQNGRA